jgi:hypothetical protein
LVLARQSLVVQKILMIRWLRSFLIRSRYFPLSLQSA